MAATAEGVFKLLDRASPRLREMRREANRTDAAFARLALTMDAIGSNKQLQQYDKADQRLRQFNRTSTITTRDNDRMGRSFRSAGRHVETFGQRLRKAGANLISIGKIIGMLKLPAIVTAVGWLAQGIGALVGGLVALLPRIADFWGIVAPLPAVLQGAGIAAGAAMLAFQGLGKAIQGDKKAMAELTPEARRFVTTLKMYAPVMKDLRESAQRGLFPGLDYSLRRIQRFVPTARGALGIGGRTGGRMAGMMADFLTRPSFMRDFITLSRHGSSVLLRLWRAVLNIGDALRHFAVAARPFTNWMIDTILVWTRHWKEMAQFNRQSGFTRAHLQRVKESMQVLGRVIKQLWGFFKALGQASRPLGDELWRSADRATKRWEDFAKSPAGRGQLTLQFIRMGDSIHAINKLLGDLGKAIWRMGTRPEFAEMTAQLDRAVPKLEQFLNTMVSTFGPVLARLLGEIVDIFEFLTGATGPLNVFLHLIADILGMFNRLMDTLKPFRVIMTTLFETYMIAKFVGWVVKLTGALKTAFAATLMLNAASGGAATVGAAATAAGIGAGTWGAAATGGVLGTVKGAAATRAAMLARYARFAPGAGMLIGGGLAATGVATGNQGLVGAGVGAGIGAWGGAKLGALAGTALGGPGLGTAIGAGVGLLAGGIAGYFLSRGGKDIGKEIADQIASVGQPRGLRSAQRQLQAVRVIRRQAEWETGGSEQRDRILGAIDQEIKAREQVVAALKREEEYRSQGRVATLLRQYGLALAPIETRQGKGAAFARATQYLTRDLAEENLTLRGQRRLAGKVVAAAADEVKKHPELEGAYKKMVDRVNRKFKELGGNAKIVNGQVIETTKTAWARWERILSTHTERGQRQVSESFAKIRTSATNMLVAMGYTPKEAAAMVRQAEHPSKAKKGGGFFGGNLPSTAPATGFRSSGLGGPRRGGPGTSGRGLSVNPTISKIASTLTGHFPLSITSSLRPGDSGSYHASGAAIDLGGSPQAMNAAAQWIMQSGMWRMLTEGIHNPNLSVKGGQVVPPAFWGAATWAQHANHIHLAAGTGLPAARLKGVMAAMGLGPIPVPHVMGNGLASLGANVAGALYGAALRSNLNKTMFGGWFGDGGTFTARRPTLIGVGERGEETVTVSRRGRPVQVAVSIGKIENHRPGDIAKAIKDEVAEAFEQLAGELDLMPMTGVA